MFSPDELLFLLPDSAVTDGAQGGFARRILVLTLAEPSATGNLDFLAKILAAAQLNLSQDTLLAELSDTTAMSLLPTLKNKQPSHILVFGLPPKQLGLNLEVVLYQPFSFYGATFLFSEKLSLLEPDKARKSQLWRALQTMFL